MGHVKIVTRDWITAPSIDSKTQCLPGSHLSDIFVRLLGGIDFICFKGMIVRTYSFPDCCNYWLWHHANLHHLPIGNLSALHCHLFYFLLTQWLFKKLFKFRVKCMGLWNCVLKVPPCFQMILLLISKYKTEWSYAFMHKLRYVGRQYKLNISLMLHLKCFKKSQVYIFILSVTAYCITQGNPVADRHEK